MIATLPAASTFNGRNYHHDKPHYHTLTVVDLDTGDKPVTATIWTSTTGATTYATLWTHSRATGHGYAGHGTATGGGYHRPSAALDAAIRSAGITLSEAIDGCGTGAMEEACRAIAVALGCAPGRLSVVSVGG